MRYFFCQKSNKKSNPIFPILSDFFRFFPIFRLFPTFRLLDSTTLVASVVVSRAAWVGRVPNGSLAEDGGLFVFTLQSGRGRREKVNANAKAK